MKIAVKTTLGFAAVMSIMMALGITAYLMFGRVADKVGELTRHALPVVQNSSAVERDALECILMQESYVLHPKEELNQKIEAKIKELKKNLDAVDGVAARFNDSDLTKKNQNVRGFIQQWIGLHDQSVADMKLRVDRIDARKKNGSQIGKDSDDFLAAKRLEYNDTKSALALLNKMSLLALKTGFDTKNRSQNLAGLQAEAEGLNQFHPDARDQKQIAEMQKAILELQEAVKSDDPQLPSKCAALEEAVEAFRVSKSARADSLERSSALVFDIWKNVSDARYLVRAYSETMEAADWVKWLSDVKKLGDLYSQLRELATADEEKQHIDRCQKNLAAYANGGNAWKEIEDKVRKESLIQIDQIGTQTIAAAKISENDAWGTIGSYGESVSQITGLTKTTVLISLLAGVIASILISRYMTLSITTPLRQAVAFAKTLAMGDLTQRLAIHRTDELGELVVAMNEISEHLGKMFNEMRHYVESLEKSSGSLSEVGARVNSNARETGAQADVTASAAEQVSHNISTVAAAAEELNASAREIAQQTSNASRVAGQAVSLANHTNASFENLGRSTAEISEIIKVITTIAEQTNLLALNATIEAARAGEAGKGFSVVAHEVKELARETTEASHDISTKIGAIQADSDSAVKAIQEIGRIINEIDKILTSVSGAVQEQAATTEEISRNVHEAADGSREITQNIMHVSGTAQSSTEAASNTSSMANELSRLASLLSKVVQQFKLNP